MSEMILAGQATRNSVLRNTYWLLALTMIPTIIGAWAGVGLGFMALVAGSPFISFLIFMAIAFGFIFAINATKNSALGIPILLAFTFFMGLMLSPLIGSILGRSDGAQLIGLAAGGTGLIFAIMATLSSVIKRDISSWGKFLMVGLIGIIIAMVANIWLAIPALALTISVLAVIIFSGFLLYDLKRVVDGGETNYISATLAVYLSLFNIFQSLLSIFGITSSDD